MKRVRKVSILGRMIKSEFNVILLKNKKSNHIKRGLLVLISLFMMVSTFGAMESIKPVTEVVDFNDNFYDDQAIEFVERGIKFYVFLDGAFDFNTVRIAEVDYLYKNGRRTPRHMAPRGIRIERDYQGRIRRIGNVFISYTYNDKVKRIGSVFVKYNRSRMQSVGNLKIVYNRHRVRFIGNVKGRYNPYYTYHWSSFNGFDHWDTWEYGYYDPFFSHRDFFNDYESFNEDDDFIYFRSKRNNGKKTKGKVIKRKKATKSKTTDSRRLVSSR